MTNQLPSANDAMSKRSPMPKAQGKAHHVQLIVFGVGHGLVIDWSLIIGHWSFRG
jgi:hypothetical protein